jgi:hypothetical protein
MSEVNVLWTSAWLTLQKDLAARFVAAGSAAMSPTFKTPAQGRVLPTSSWLLRARGALNLRPG